MAAPERFAETSDSSCIAGAVHTWHFRQPDYRRDADLRRTYWRKAPPITAIAVKSFVYCSIHSRSNGPNSSVRLRSIPAVKERAFCERLRVDVARSGRFARHHLT